MEKENIKIGLIGKGGTGKDLVADYLVNDFNFSKLTFSDGLYEICRNYFGMEKKNRKLLQDVGVAMRSVDVDVFVKKTLRDVDILKYVVVTDVRHPNEYQALKDKGFKMVKVECPIEERIRRIEKRDNLKIDDHEYDRLENSPIEKYMDSFEVDYVLDNSSSIEDVYERIHEMLKEFE